MPFASSRTGLVSNRAAKKKHLGGRQPPPRPFFASLRLALPLPLVYMPCARRQNYPHVGHHELCTSQRLDALTLMRYLTIRQRAPSPVSSDPPASSSFLLLLSHKLSMTEPSDAASHHKAALTLQSPPCPICYLLPVWGLSFGPKFRLTSTSHNPAPHPCLDSPTHTITSS
jgi:hypothetical protein